MIGKPTAYLCTFCENKLKRTNVCRRVHFRKIRTNFLKSDEMYNISVFGKQIFIYFCFQKEKQGEIPSQSRYRTVGSPAENRAHLCLRTMGQWRNHSDFKP